MTSVRALECVVTGEGGLGWPTELESSRYKPRNQDFRGGR